VPTRPANHPISGPQGQTHIPADTRHDETKIGAATFHSILIERPDAAGKIEVQEAPGFFPDLNLDLILFT
jgi:hypothetical protein